MAELTGLAAVLAGAAPTADPPGDEAEQYDLLGLPAPRPGHRVEAYRGRGRPAGSRNKRTVEWAQHLLGRYSSPLEVLAQVMTAPVEALVAQLGCSPVEALAEKRLAAVALLPYLHSRMPVSVDLTDRRVVHLTIAVDESVAPAAADGVVARVLESAEFQRVSMEATDDVGQEQV